MKIYHRNYSEIHSWPSLTANNNLFLKKKPKEKTKKRIKKKPKKQKKVFLVINDWTTD